MIPKISKGSDFGGLVRYLAGPGKSNEHTAQHVMGGSLGYTSGALDQAMVAQVSADLRAPSLAFPDAAGKADVWHCSLSLAASEGALSDAKWQAIAGDFMRGMGFEDPAKAGVRWVAVRHGLSSAGNDHVHIAANLVREDGSRVDTFRDWPRAQAMCNQLEHQHGLEVLASREAGTGRPGVSRAELERSAATGRAPDRAELELAVRRAAGASRGEAEFVRRLRADGLELRPRVDQATGKVTGYAVARSGGPWFGGGKLSRDLTLPRLRSAWGVQPAAAAVWESPGKPGREARPAVVSLTTYREATAELRGLERQIRGGGMDTAALGGAAHRVAGALAAAATRPEHARGPVPAAAREAGRMAGTRARNSATGRLALSAGLLFMQAMDPDSQQAQAIMLRQLMATYSAVREAHRVIGAPTTKGAAMSTSDGVDEVVEGLATVAVTVAARRLEGRAQAKAEEARRAAKPVRKAAGATPADAARGGRVLAQVKAAGNRQRTAAAPSDPVAWRTQDVALTPRQRLTLAGRGYEPADLDGMSKRVASLHIGHKLTPADAVRSRGSAPTVLPVDTPVAKAAAAERRPDDLAVKRERGQGRRR